MKSAKKANRPEPSGETLYAVGRVLFRAVGLARLSKGLLKGSNSQLVTSALILIRTQQIGDGAVDLSHPAFLTMVKEAAAKKDQEFFKTIGRELSSAPLRKENAASKLEWFLISYWDGSIGRLGPNAPPLNVLNRDALATVCTHYVKGPMLSSAKVEKARARLGLAPAKGKKLNIIESGGRLKRV